MFRISAIAVVASLTISSGLMALGSAEERDELATREFELASVQLPEAMTVLRTMVGTRHLRPMGDRRLLVTDRPEKLELAEKVVQMIDAPSPDENGFESFTIPAGPAGDSVIATLSLQDVAARDAMDALRILSISRIAPCCNDGLMVIRDSPDQVESARKLVQVLERVSRESN